MNTNLQRAHNHKGDKAGTQMNVIQGLSKKQLNEPPITTQRKEKLLQVKQY